MKRKIRTLVKKNNCKYCKTIDNLTIDHKIPRCQGGSDDIKNLQCLCERCNSMKSGMSDKQVRRLFRWFIQVQKSREEHGKNPYSLKH